MALKTSFYVPMFAFVLWSTFAMVRALRWASLPKEAFEVDHQSRQIVLFNSLVSIMLALGVFTYANNNLTIDIRLPSMAIGSLVTWQLVTNLVIASYAWGKTDGKSRIRYDDWRRNFTRIVSLVNVIVVLMTIFGVELVDFKKLKSPLKE